MIQCNQNDLNKILNYIGKRYGECLYLYLDMLKYGFTNENVHIWYQETENNLNLIVLQYYNGMHVFTKDLNKVDFDDLLKLISNRNPTMICGMGPIIKKLNESLTDFKIEIGYVGNLKENKVMNTDNCSLATLDDLKDVAAFLATDEALGKPYGYDLLYKQLVERYTEHYGRTFILKENDKIIGTASTYAEENHCAVVSGVLIDENYRGRGLSKIVLSALCHHLHNDGFEVFSYYYINQAIKMHHSVGFEDIGEWAKLVKE